MKKTNIVAGLITCLFAGSGLLNEVNAQSWGLNGNAGTTSTNYIGTSDAKGFTIKTNNSKRVTVTSSGNVGIGQATPAYRLDVNGGTGAKDTIAAVNVVVKKTGNYDVIAVRGTSQPAVGYGIGVQGIGNSIGAWGDGGWGVLGTGGNVGGWFQSGGYLDTTSATGNSADGIDAIAGPANTGYGVYAQSNDSRFNFAIYSVCGPTGTASDSDNTHSNWAGYFNGDIVSSRSYKFSDAKLKNNIQPITNALDKLNRLQTATYTFRQSEFPDLILPGGNQIGFIAENMQTVFPELVKDATSPAISANRGRDGRASVAFKAVNYDGIIPVTVQAIKEQQIQLDQKTAQIDQQNAKIAELEGKINQLASIMQQSGQITEQQKNAIVKSTDNAKLFQNQPNPVNGLTTIGYYLPTSVKSASINVTNALGVVVKNISISQRGNGQVTLNSTEIGTGNYTYSLVVDGKVLDSKSMMMTR